MKKRTVLGLAVSVATSYPVTLNALGLGDLQSSSQLNQPLNAQIELLSTGETGLGQLRVKLASVDVFNRVGIDRPAYLNSLKFRTTTKNGKPVILVSSAQPVTEPFLNFLLEVSWPQGQLLKEYTVLLDPPVLIQAGGSAPQNTASVRAEPKASGVVNRTDSNEKQNQQQTRTKEPLQAPTAQQRVLEAQAKIAAEEEQRISSSVTKPTTVASGGKKYRVRAGDTMQKVTSRLRYSGTTSSQMMIALFKANPHAFAKNNINYLKKGEVLTRPPRAAVTESSKSAARAQIKQHYAAWKQYRKGLAAKTVAQTSASSSAKNIASTAKTTTDNEQNSSQNNTKSTNTLNAEKATPKVIVAGSNSKEAKGDNVSGSGSADLQKKLILVEEALASTSSKNVELVSRVNKLESIVRKKDRMIMLKNERLARLENQLANADIASKPLPEVTSAKQASKPKVNEAEDLATSVGNETGQDNNIIIRDDETKATEVASASVVDTANKPAEVSATIEHEKVAEIATNNKPATSPLITNNNGVEEGGLLDLLKSPLVASIGGGSLLVLILGGLFLRRRQALEPDHTNDEFTDAIDTTDNKNTDFPLGDEVFDNTDFTANKAKVDANDITYEPDSHVQDDRTDGKQHFGREDEEDELDKVLSADSSLDEDEILQEADVYIVYGLHEQAEEELKKAIAEKPSKLEYRYKLLENYQVAGNSEAFVASAEDFLKIEGDNKQQLWEKIVELGKKIAPENDMFAEKSSAKAATVFAGVAAAAIVASNTESEENTSENVNESVSVSSSDLAALDSTVSNDEFESLLNTDIDLGFDDLDLGLDLSDVESGNSDDSELKELDFVNESSILSDVDLDLELGLNDAVKMSDNELKKDTDELDLSEFSDLSTDDEFDFEGLDSLEGLGGLDDFEPDNSNVLNFKEVESTLASDSASLNLELDSSTGLDKVLPTSSYSSALSDSNINNDDDDNDALSFLNLPDDDQEMQDAHIGTKLDLARAYLDMGDVEGARCTLEEVVVEGNEAQKREAEEMLQQTG